jgi:ABC-type Co2+ transport system permease subunit
VTDTPLTPGQRLWFLVLALAMAAAGLAQFATATEFVAWFPTSKLAMLTAAILVLNTLAFLVVAGSLGRTHAGSLTWRTCKDWVAWVWIAYLVLLGCLFLAMSLYLSESLRDSIRGIGLVLLVYAAIAWLRHRVAQTEHRIAEQLQGMQQRLDEIGQSLEAPQSMDTECDTRVTNRTP